MVSSIFVSSLPLRGKCVAALKLAEKDIGKVHYSADIGCHAFATFAPFNFGNSILGYGMSLASNASVASFQQKRPLAVMGDGGFWHNGLLSGVTSRLMNGGDGVLVIMKNGYTSATGTQEIISTPDEEGIVLPKQELHKANITNFEFWEHHWPPVFRCLMNMALCNRPFYDGGW